MAFLKPTVSQYGKNIFLATFHQNDIICEEHLGILCVNHLLPASLNIFIYWSDLLDFGRHLVWPLANTDDTFQVHTAQKLGGMGGNDNLMIVSAVANSLPYELGQLRFNRPSCLGMEIDFRFFNQQKGTSLVKMLAIVSKESDHESALDAAALVIIRGIQPIVYEQGYLFVSIIRRVRTWLERYPVMENGMDQPFAKLSCCISKYFANCFCQLLLGIPNPFRLFLVLALI